MSEYDKFDKRVSNIESDVSNIESDVSDLKVGIGTVNATLNNGIKENLKCIRETVETIQKTEAESRRIDRELIITVKTVLDEHLKSHKGLSGNVKYVLTTAIALIAIGISIFSQTGVPSP